MYTLEPWKVKEQIESLDEEMTEFLYQYLADSELKLAECFLDLRQREYEEVCCHELISEHIEALKVCTASAVER